MKVTELKENEGILCPTKQEATAICKLMHEAGLRWRSNNKYIDKNRWECADEGGLVYYPFDGWQSDSKSAKDEKRTTYPASDFLTPEPAETPNQPRLIDFLKVGDKVWDCIIGEWITVVSLDEDDDTYVIKCRTSDDCSEVYAACGRGNKRYKFPTLHLAEWHPERGEPMPTLPDPDEPRVGEWCLFGDDECDQTKTIGILGKIDTDCLPFFCEGNEIYYRNCIPIRGDKMPNWNELLNIKTNQPKQ